jgi:hypothetical protein
MDSVSIINTILSRNKNMLLLKNGERFGIHEKIDIWWRGQNNGNLMVLLAYIMNSAVESRQRKKHHIRIIRKLGKDENAQEAQSEMEILLERARLEGEVVILEYDDTPFRKTLQETSGHADLIMMGLPGNYTESETEGLFNLSEFFFDREIMKYSELPPVLFVKSAYTLNLLED